MTEIIKRNEKPIIGTLQITKKVAMLTRPDGTLAHDILIPNDKLKGGRDGDKAIVRITDWPERANKPDRRSCGNTRKERREQHGDARHTG